jgi:hypothetical protein
MKTIMAGCIAVFLLASAGALEAHHSLAQFDTTTAVRVRGTIVLLQVVNPHSIIFLDQFNTDGRVQRWAVEGPTAGTLMRIGVKDVLKPGAVIEVCGYVTKDGVDAIRTVDTASISSIAKFPMPTRFSGRLMDGELVIMPDGRQQRWSDYGHHKCLGEDYQDNHRK